LGFNGGTRSPDDLQRESDVLEDSFVGQKSEVLEDTANVAPQERYPKLGQFGEFATGFEDPSLVGQLLAQEQAKERGLARTRRADQEDELSFFDVERYVLQGGRAVFVGLRDILKADHANTPSGT